MNTHPSIEKAQAYLNVQLGDSRSSWPRRTEGPFVTISRESGAGGSTLARLLVTRLNHDCPAEKPWTVYAGNLIESMLESNKLDPSLARFLPEDSVSTVNTSVGELVGLHPSLWQLTEKTNELMRALARAGRVILVGRGSNFATAGVPNGVHVRLVAPSRYRARYMADQQEVGETAAVNFNLRQDAARQRYVRATFNEDVTDSTAYDLTLNTGRMSLEHACELVGATVHTRTPAVA